MLISTVTLFISSTAVNLLRATSALFSRAAATLCGSLLLISITTSDHEFFEKGIGIYGGLYQSTDLITSFQTLIFILTFLILILTSFFPRKLLIEKVNSVKNIFSKKLVYFNEFIENRKANQFKITEYSLVIIFIIIGGTLLIASFDLVSLFLSLELQSYGLYILCTVYRNSERSVSGGLMYFLLGGLSSCFVLLAAGLLYSNSGNTNLEGIYVINNISPIYSLTESFTENYYSSYYIGFSFLILSVGFLFKLSAAPFHFWSPDVYDSIPTIVTTFVAIIAKISLFIILFELMQFSSSSYSVGFSWTQTLIISSLISLIIGSVLGLTQFRIKRLFAYSTISHVGFILLALTINSVESIQSFMFYLIQYSLSNLNAFIILITIGYSLYCYTDLKNNDKKYSTNGNNTQNLFLIDKQNSPIQLVSQLKGYFKLNPYLALSLAITLFSFAGIPPLVGFFAKQMVLSSALDSGYVFISFIAIITSVISAYYYLVIVKQMFFYDTDYKINSSFKDWSGESILKQKFTGKSKEIISFKLTDVSVSSSLTIIISILSLITLFFIFTPNELLILTNILALTIFNE